MRHAILSAVSALLVAGAARADSPSPALAPIIASGASLAAQGTEHGLRTFLARNGAHFMVFDLAPDGQAIVSGLLLQLPLDQLVAASGSRLTELPRAHGLRAFFLRNGSQFQVFYATPDEQRVIPGLMWDAAGHNLTRQQIAGIPGTRPTVELGRLPAPADNAAPGDASAMLQALSATTTGPIGAAAAPTAWMFVDPQCQFSVRAMQELKPATDQGRLRLAVVPLSILDREDQGLSTSRALAMLGKPAAEMVPDWQQDRLDGITAPTAAQQLHDNMTAARTLDLKGTPTFFWRRKDGSLGRFDGVPASPDALLRAMGAEA